MRTHAALAEHIDMNTKQILQVLPQAHQINQAASRFHLYEQVDIARLVQLASDDRAKHAHVARAVIGRVAQNLLPPGTQLSKIDVRRRRTHAGNEPERQIKPVDIKISGAACHADPPASPRSCFSPPSIPLSGVMFWPQLRRMWSIAVSVVGWP
jgi:hypothetical protein